ncbi:hypothetical protein [Reyranella sp.]|uniref:hypothetical protein n=1 Tax=Reyranella sp. TaxID=1929291 RepID=UPI003BA9F252
MRKKTNRGLPIARLLMVVSSLAPLFVLWAIRGASPVPDCYWIGGCLALAVLPTMALIGRWLVAIRRNDHRILIVTAARDHSDHLLIYLFTMLLPLYAANLTSTRELISVATAFVFIVFLFWHMNLHYMNLGFAILGFRVYTIDLKGADGGEGRFHVILLSKRMNSPQAGALIHGLRISDTVYVEKASAHAP